MLQTPLPQPLVEASGRPARVSRRAGARVSRASRSHGRANDRNGYVAASGPLRGSCSRVGLSTMCRTPAFTAASMTEKITRVGKEGSYADSRVILDILDILDYGAALHASRLSRVLETPRRRDAAVLAGRHADAMRIDCVRAPRARAAALLRQSEQRRPRRPRRRRTRRGRCARLPLRIARGRYRRAGFRTFSALPSRRIAERRAIERRRAYVRHRRSIAREHRRTSHRGEQNQDCKGPYVGTHVEFLERVGWKADWIDCNRQEPVGRSGCGRADSAAVIGLLDGRTSRYRCSSQSGHITRHAMCR